MFTKLYDLLGSFFMDIIETVVIALSVFLIVYLFLMQPHQVNGQSMEPNFLNREYLLTDKVSYKRRLPQRGEVVVFHAPPEAGCPEGAGCDFVKRVIGLPGETIEVKDGVIWVNDKQLEEEYLPSEFTTRAGPYTSRGPVNIGPNEYFVAGDNRDHSSDSRAWGPVEYRDIVGRVFFRYWPPQKIGLVEHAEY